MKFSAFSFQLLKFFTRRESPAEEELNRHLAQVSEQDHCLLAVRELLGRHLLVNAATAGSIASDDTLKLRACERMEFARCFLLELENRLETAREWRQEQEARK